MKIEGVELRKANHFVDERGVVDRTFSKDENDSGFVAEKSYLSSIQFQLIYPKNHPM
jgi:dTDP-4-dehydrorhamnose 3,5-epimerase-like enzyme